MLYAFILSPNCNRILALRPETVFGRIEHRDHRYRQIWRQSALYDYEWGPAVLFQYYIES